jgi:hypothetical protein
MTIWKVMAVVLGLFLSRKLALKLEEYLLSKG